MKGIKTFDDAVAFVLENKVVGILGCKGSPYPSLWDHTDLSEDKPAEGGWSPKVKAVWDWKTRIPQTYPNEVFYGKLGCEAILMEMEYLRTTHYAAAYQPVEALDALSRRVYALIEEEPGYTGDLRKRAVEATGCTKSRFDTALKKLQVSLNVMRSNDSGMTNDFWLPFREVHLDIVSMHAH